MASLKPDIPPEKRRNPNPNYRPPASVRKPTITQDQFGENTEEHKNGEITMTNVHKPKYLKQEPPTTQEMEDAEVFAMVKGNINRKVDANTLPPIAMDNDGKLFFTDPAPAKSEVTMAVCMVLAFLLVVVVAIVSLTAHAVGPWLLSICTVVTTAVLAIITMKGEKKNVKH